MRDDDCVSFLSWALPRLGLRWRGFRKPRRQVCRRVARRLDELGLTGLDAYRRRLETDPAEWEVLDRLCRVTISRFLRDRAVFDALGRDVLPELARRAAASGRAAVRAWSAGCASGEEPFSLRLVWRFAVAPVVPEAALEVVATDADPHLLERARRGVYPESSLRDVPAEWRRRAFDVLPPAGPDQSTRFRLHDDLRRGVELRRHDLRRAPPPGRFDLVLCRNLAWTYFDLSEQGRALARIATALRPGGTLVVGAHESLPAGPHAEGLFAAAGASRYRRLAAE